MITMWKFDREKGRIDPGRVLQPSRCRPTGRICATPASWSPTAGASATRFNTELATGGIEEGNPPFEAGVSQRDTDYLHIFNWKKAEEVVSRPARPKTINGMRVIRIPTAVEEGMLFLAPEPKSPHGVDVTPDGKYMVVAGKLDPHVTIYCLRQDPEGDRRARSGRPTTSASRCSNFDDVMLAQVELGLGPLHTQFDDKGYAYTSLFLDSAVAKWKLGGDDPAAYELLEKLPVQYNIGHISAAEGDTVSPDGKYLVALNKWAVDRFLPVGPLLPQNEQLIDISGDTMKVIYDMPMGIGEPHYAQMIKTDKTQAVGCLSRGRLGSARPRRHPNSPPQPARRRSCATATRSRSS